MSAGDGKRKRGAGTEPGPADEGEAALPYQLGAVKRVMMKNFVCVAVFFTPVGVGGKCLLNSSPLFMPVPRTYTSVEVCPGPNLNVVIGPNGTGKSTIISAICLGLAGKTEVLGRQKKVADFVQTGHETAVIEVELHNEPRPTIIRRTITKASNSSTWQLNGKASRQEDVLEAVAALNIQVSNLCQFLPQDKVPEFARMTPEQLLEATEQAVRCCCGYGPLSLRGRCLARSPTAPRRWWARSCLTCTSSSRRWARTSA